MPLVLSMCCIDEEQPGFIEHISYICERMEELDRETVETFVDHLENAAPNERPALISTLLQLAEIDLEQLSDENE